MAKPEPQTTNLWRKIFPLSATAKSIISLWKTDRQGWSRDNFGAVHVKTGIGVWLANSTYGLQIYHGINEVDAKHCFLLHGSKMSLNGRDRRAIWRAFKDEAYNHQNEVTKSIYRFSMLKEYEDVG